MTNINIFLASSLEELAEDREALGNYIRKLNDIYMDRGIYFRLYECEYENVAMSIEKRKQEEYNKKIYDSQLFVVLFYNKAGEYTVEEFDTAYQSFKESGSPAIITCFRQGEGYEPKQSVLDFMKRLDEQLGHYFKRYTHIDSLKLSLLMQVKLMNLDIPIELDDSCVKVGGKSVLTLENIPMWSKNADFQHLKEEYTTCEQAYLDAKTNTTDPATDPVFLQASQKWHDAKQALHQMEQDLFAIALKAEEKSKEGTLTARQRKAYELMEQGDSAGANRILDLHEILDDIAYAESLAEQTDEKLEQHVQELLQKIEILKTQIDNPNRFDEIRSIFEEAAALEERRHLKKVATREYISHLYQQKDYQTVVPLAEEYLQYMELQGKKDDIADAVALLGVLHLCTGRLKEAEQEFLREEEIYKQLVVEDPSAYMQKLAYSYSNLGVVYTATNRMKDAETKYLSAKKIREQLATDNSSVYQPDLAESYTNLGALYLDNNRKKEAEAEFLHAKELYAQLAEENPSVHLRDLANSCCNLGALYLNINRLEEAETEFLCAKKIQEPMAIENPSAYLPDLAMSCNNLGILYIDMNKLEDAETMLLQMKQKLVPFATDPTDIFTRRLARSAHLLGQCYADMNCFEEAESEYQQALKLYNGGPDTEKVYSDLKILWSKRKTNEDEKKRQKELNQTAEKELIFLDTDSMSEEAISQAETDMLNRKETLEQSEEKSALAQLADLCYILGRMYDDLDDTAKAEKEYYQALGLYDRLSISCSAFSKRADRVNIDLQVLINLQPDSLGLVDYSEPEGEDMEENDEPDGGFFHRLFSRFKK